MRCASGIWPPSKPRRKPSLRAFCPFWPRPEVLPRPEPVPRPIRRALRCAPAAGFRSCSCTLVTPLVLLVGTRPPDLVAAALRAHVGLTIDRDQERDGLQHAAYGGVVGQLACLIHTAKAERLDRCPQNWLGPDGAFHQSRLQGLFRGGSLACGSHLGSLAAGAAVSAAPLPLPPSARLYAFARRRPTIWSTSLPRSSATCWAVFSCCSAASVARTVLIGLLVPCDLVRMSLMPAVSMTARMAPPEITPVPGAAGLSMIRAAPSLSRTSCGIVVPTIGMVIMLRLATSMPLRMASVTSRALPMPAPTRPFMSPTTISALNENLRPPLTTLATRLTRTTRSASSERSPLLWGYRDPMRF